MKLDGNCYTVLKHLSWVQALLLRFYWFKWYKFSQYRPWNIEIFTCNQEKCNFRFDLGFPGLLRHLCINWNMASEDDHLHLSCENSDSEEENKRKKEKETYQKMLVNNMAYSRIRLNHIQQKTSLLTIAVIYHWRELPQVSSLSRHSFCHDKTRLLSRFVATKLCRRQKWF